MAEGGLVDDILRCAVCKETFSSPVCLPCGHSFCLDCVSNIKTTAFASARRYRPFFLCPTCRWRVDVPANGIAYLPRNYAVEHIVQESLAPKMAFCDECRKWDQNETATWMCVECDLYFCTKCKVVHLHSVGSSKPHHLREVVLEGITKSETSSATDAICGIHDGEQLRLYCVECNVAICRDCYINEHKGHTIESLRQVAAKAREKLKIINDGRRAELRNFESSIEELKNNILSANRNKVNELAKIREHTKLIVEAIEKKAIFIENEIEIVYANSIDTLQRSLDTLMFYMTDLQSLIDKDDAIINSRQFVETVHKSQSLSPINESQRITAIDVDEVENSLYCVTFIKANADLLDVDDILGTCETHRLLLSSKFKESFVTYDGSTSQAIAHSPRLVRSFETDYNVAAAVTTSSGDIVLACGFAGLVIYNNDGSRKASSLFAKPKGVFKWCISDVSIGNDDSLVLVNHASGKDGGGCYFYNADAENIGRILMDWGRSVAFIDQKEVAVTRLNRDGSGRLEIWKSNGEIVATTHGHNEGFMWNPRYVARNKRTGEVIVTHKGSVTAFSYPDLSPRWTYHGEGDKKLGIPQGVCVDSWGRVLVADCDTRRRVVFVIKDGAYITHFTTIHCMKYIFLWLLIIPRWSLSLTRCGQLMVSSGSKKEVCIIDYLHRN